MKTGKGHCRILGATLEEHGVNFSLWARLASEVELLLFDSPDDISPQIITLSPRQNRTAYTGMFLSKGSGMASFMVGG